MDHISDLVKRELFSIATENSDHEVGGVIRNTATDSIIQILSHGSHDGVRVPDFTDGIHFHTHPPDTSFTPSFS